jgi:deaminated glutathione amidase
MTLVSAVQMTSTFDVQQNLATAAGLIATASAQGARLVVLPEMFPLMGAEETKLLEIQEEYGAGVIQDFLSAQARQHKLWLGGGTLPIKTQDPNRARAACILYDDQGKPVSRYDKIHLFDVTVKPGIESYRESNTVSPGTEIVIADTPFGKLGLAVCYDIRFPELFRRLTNQGAEIIAVPCAFTVKTGQDHWDALTRCRAIESLSYFIFACQTGQHSQHKSTYGYSRIVNPWGKVLNQLDSGQGVITAEIDLEFQRSIRKQFPALEHQRIRI